MKSVFLVIVNTGDGANTVEWYKDVTLEQLYKLEEEDPDSYSSGDGFQVRTLDFPDNFDLDEFAKVNYITWNPGFEDDDWEDDDKETSFD